MRHEDLALALGISRDTLSKHYGTELSTGAALRRLEVLQAQFRTAIKKGSTAAARAYLAVEPELAAPPAPDGQGRAAPATATEPSAPTEPAPKLAQPMGKKDQARADASTAAAGTEWDKLLPTHGLPQ